MVANYINIFDVEFVWCALYNLFVSGIFTDGV